MLEVVQVAKVVVAGGGTVRVGPARRRVLRARFEEFAELVVVQGGATTCGRSCRAGRSAPGRHTPI